MTKARTLADFISDGSPLADGTISVSEVSGAAPLASPTFTGAVTSPQINLVNPNNSGKVLVLDVDQGDVISVGDLEIYDDRTSGIGYMLRTDTSTQAIGADAVVIMDRTGQKSLANFAYSGDIGTAKLRYWDSNGGYDKLTTNATGIDVTGRITTDAITEDTSGNVGIGTSSPTTTLTLDSGGTPTTLKIDSLTESSIDFDDKGGSAKRYKIGTNISSNDGQFEFKDMTANAERMRIDSSGNLLVGGTSAYGNSTFTVGFDGDIKASSSSRSAIFNSTTSGYNGSLVDFRVADVAVGSIGSVDGNSIRIGKGDGNLRFYDFGSAIAVIPCNSSGANQSNVVDLGNSSSTFKDLYLSGGVYLGGTGAANKLDDYEEGTWIPSLGGTATYSALQANYVKVGSLVQVKATILVNAIGTGSATTITGLPYTNGDGIAALNIAVMTNSATSVVHVAGSISANSSQITMRAMAAAAASYSVTNIFGSGTYIEMSGSYSTIT